jgi:hypothetical protein
VITKPSYEVAQNAYQTLLELHRRHPDDADLLQSLHHATELVNTLHAELAAERRARL